ncbi:unnamed protein product [Cercospora beticola]|nr:unnamed protein product [Cercospora beticola]
MQKSPHLLAGTEIYRPLCTELQQIRLLTILPGSGDEELRCHLSTASLHHELRPFYETISYAWGDRDLRANVVVNNSALNVPRGTKDAIRCMRLADDERVVWIDAICINQNDILERGAQVSMMGTIYMNGAKNLVFLGNDEENVAETAIATPNRTHRHVERLTGDLSSEHQTELGDGTLPRNLRLDLRLTERAIELYEVLYGLPWFRRLWVVQEAAFASRSTCYWGSTRFPLSRALLVGSVMPNILTEAVRPLPIRDGYRAQKMRILESFTRQALRPKAHFGYFTGYLEGFSTSELRDRVFAAVQLYLKWNDMPQVPFLLVSDYSKSVPEVYRDATRFILRDEGSYHRTQFEQVRHRSSQDLAVERNGSTSRTIRFDRTFDFNFDPLKFRNEFNAGYKDNTTYDDVFPDFLDNPDPNLLIIKALLIDNVTTTTESFAWQEEDDYAQTKCILETLRGWAKGDTIAQVLTGSCWEEFGFQSNDSSERLESYHFFCQYVFASDSLPPRTWHLHKSSTRKERYAAWFHESFRNLTSNRRLFLTRDRRIGCGPKLMQEGDVVFVAKGAAHACILRPVEGKDYWLYVGEAYVHGLMHGEIFDQDEINWEWVKLR